MLTPNFHFSVKPARVSEVAKIGANKRWRTGEGGVQESDSFCCLVDTSALLEALIGRGIHSSITVPKVSEAFRKYSRT